MLQNDDNVNMMLSWCMKYNNTLSTTFLHGIVASQQNQLAILPSRTTQKMFIKKPYILLKNYPKFYP